MHIFALAIISLAFFAKIISMMLIGDLHKSVRLFEFISIATYCGYIGWLGFVRREWREENGKYILYATLLVILDVGTYYLFKGWK